MADEIHTTPDHAWAEGFSRAELLRRASIFYDLATSRDRSPEQHLYGKPITEIARDVYVGPEFYFWLGADAYPAWPEVGPMDAAAATPLSGVNQFRPLTHYGRGYSDER
jgi:hypothetical protein